MYLLNLIREINSEGSRCENTFLAEDTVTDPGQAIRDAVQDFLKTEEGSAEVAFYCNNLNWGDVIYAVPEEIWNQHGLHFRSVRAVEVLVNGKEVLSKSNEEGVSVC